MHANVDASVMRRMNRATVLKVIRDLRTTSRSDISQITGLNKATVSHIVDELIAEQFVLEVGYGSSSGGRKPILLRFNANAAYAIGLNMQITHITTVVCNVRGETAYTRTTPIELGKDDAKDQILSLLESEIQLAMAGAPKSPYGIVGACVALPGMVNFKSGTVYYLPNAFTGEWNIKQELASRVEIPILLDNDANCGAWNEYVGNGAQVRNLVYVNAGVGLGAGLVIDGRLYRGRDGMAGEFGHMSIMPFGSQCLCGSYGCWEEYGSERSLLRYLFENGEDASLLDDSKSIIAQALTQAQGDNRAYIRAFHTLGQQLGIGIANIMNALNPDEIILGGNVVDAATFVVPEIQRMVNHRALFKNKKTPIRVGNVNAVAIGASNLAMNEVLFSLAEDASDSQS